MAGAAQPGPTCGETNPVNVNDGTSCRAATPQPGVLSRTWSTVSGWGSSAASSVAGVGHSLGSWYDSKKASLQRKYDWVKGEARLDYEGGLCIYLAYERANDLALDAILEETGYQLKTLIQGLIPGLLQMIVIVGATTLLGATIGGIVGFFFGGVGAAPGAVVGGELGLDAGIAILTWLGLAFLAVEIIKGMGEMLHSLQNGILWAWNARRLNGAAQAREVDRAGRELARCVGILVRLILQAILAYILKKAAMGATRSVAATARAVQTEGAVAVSDATIGEIVGKIRASKFGNGLADWVKDNWRDMEKNPRLRPKEPPPQAGGASSPAESPTVKPKPKQPPKSPAEENPDLSTNAKKGVFGEARADAYMKENGFKKLNGPDVQVGDAAKGQGIDGVYENLNPPPKYVVADAKFGSSKLGTTQDGMQMSENWVDNRLNSAVGRSVADDIRAEGYQSWVLKVDEAGNVTPKIVNEDALGKITLTDPPGS